MDEALSPVAEESLQPRRASGLLPDSRGEFPAHIVTSAESRLPQERFLFRHLVRAMPERGAPRDQLA